MKKIKKQVMKLTNLNTGESELYRNNFLRLCKINNFQYYGLRYQKIPFNFVDRKTNIAYRIERVEVI